MNHHDQQPTEAKAAPKPRQLADKSTGKQNKITITNKEGWLYNDKITKMVNDAETFYVEDKKKEKKNFAKNGLEIDWFTMTTTSKDDKFRDRISANHLKANNDKYGKTNSN